MSPRFRRFFGLGCVALAALLLGDGIDVARDAWPSIVAAEQGTTPWPADPRPAFAPETESVLAEVERVPFLRSESRTAQR